MSFWREDDTHITLFVQISPNARTSEYVGIQNDIMKIRIQAKPIDGEANTELIRFIAQTCGVPKSLVVIEHGLSGRHKRLKLPKTNQAIHFFEELS